MRFNEFFRICCVTYLRLLTKIDFRFEIQKISLTKHSTISRFFPQFFVKSSDAEMRCETEMEVDLLGVCLLTILIFFDLQAFVLKSLKCANTPQCLQRRTGKRSCSQQLSHRKSNNWP